MDQTIDAPVSLAQLSSAQLSSAQLSQSAQCKCIPMMNQKTCPEISSSSLWTAVRHKTRDANLLSEGKHTYIHWLAGWLAS
jgi:hypothetical protein